MTQALGLGSSPVKWCQAAGPWNTFII
jgi:hypothetical protein